MDHLIPVLGWNLTAVTGMMFVGWLLSLVYKNVTLVDSLWGLGFVLIAWISFGLSEGYMGRKILIGVLTTTWGLRLSAHLAWRNWGKGEDPRYGSWHALRPMPPTKAELWTAGFGPIRATRIISGKV